jgi:hypothetical protein
MLQKNIKMSRAASTKIGIQRAYLLPSPYEQKELLKCKGKELRKAKSKKAACPYLSL